MIFLYECKKCHNKFELLIGVTIEKTLMECPECHSRDIVKLISAPFIKAKELRQGEKSCSTGFCSL